MPEQTFRYIIIGAGLAGASAVEGIRQRDAHSPILLIGAEAELPYNRPPLTKQLWLGKQKEEEIFVHDAAFYAQQGVELRLGTTVTAIDPGAHTVTDARKNTYRYEKLLLATGGSPRRLTIPGGNLDGLIYYRHLADYHSARQRVAAGKSALVIGGGFIGSEIAAALSVNKLSVTMLFPGPHLVSRVFPADLAKAITEQYRAKGVAVMAGDAPVSIARNGAGFISRTRQGKQIESDLVVVGIGIDPGIKLAQAAGVKTGDGIIVDDRLGTSDPDIYAAGDNAFFPYAALGISTRMEHWDNALNQGKHAGANLAGADQPFTYMPFFFSDLFEFGYEAVGQVDTRLTTFADWQEPFKTGVVYYLEDRKVRGVMMCNVWEKVDAARELIRSAKRMTDSDLKGAIK